MRLRERERENLSWFLIRNYILFIFDAGAGGGGCSEKKQQQQQRQRKHNNQTNEKKLEWSIISNYFWSYKICSRNKTEKNEYTTVVVV